MMNVLLVDDEPWVLEGLRTMVNWKSHGFQVCGEALNGPDALKMIQELKPELVVTDINMPVLNGLELVEQSNKTLARPPKFVILSGYDNFNYALTAIRHKVAEYLLKPIDEEEIETILDQIGKRIREELAAEQSQSRVQFLFKNNLLNRLIQGEYNEALEQQAARSLDLERKMELRCVLVEAVPGCDDLRQRIQGYFAQERDRSFQDISGRVGVIVPEDNYRSAVLEEIVLRMHRDLSDSLSQPVIITLSDTLKGISSIRSLYLQTLEVGKSKRSQDKEGVFYYKYCKQPAGAVDVYKEKIKQLAEKVTADDAGKIRGPVDEILGSFASGLQEIEIAKAHIADLELTLCRKVADMNGEPDVLMKTMWEQHGSLSGISNYPALKSYVQDLCLEAASFLSRLTRQNENNTIFHVIQYVDREYKNKLQLQDLAKHFHMNATYLGQLFKRETGKPFNEYLNEKRIEEAKSLLKRTQIKISDVALQVGYPNTDYFISKFKSSTGMLPSAYKHAAENKPADH
ncbi:two-component system response regulator YesN [Fontibacillus phaseoli]|uniref:Two-component system response regulator YesN n=1 Tax=Fontibacillus phaseoli TaxID=1416533 RepID=A0A369B604_9BACL|nr:response regulator [Fontibacillus phaseoli]RCX16755.1 two-component system response regulator YesN [Fontibacillus phaseoli]